MFHEVVKENWKVEIQGIPFNIAQQKMKIIKKVLTKWSKEIYVNIFQSCNHGRYNKGEGNTI